MFNNSSTTNNKSSKIAGQFHAAKGEAKEGLGRTFASADLQQAGREERAAGEAQYNAARHPAATGEAQYNASHHPAATGEAQYNTHPGTGEAQYNATHYPAAPSEAQYNAARHLAATGDHATGKSDPAVGSLVGDRTQNDYGADDDMQHIH